MSWGLDLGLGLGLTRRQGGGAFRLYVDSINGDDDNDGTSPSKAFATLSALGTVAANERIGIAKGSSFRESLVLTNAGISIGTYGTGDKPVISGADVITGWTLTAAQTNTYEKAVVCGSGELSTSIYVRAFEDGARLTRQTSIANVEANAGSYYAAGTHPNYTIYVHATGSGNPESNGKEYEVTTRAYGITAGTTVHDITVEGVQTERSCHIDGSLVLRGLRNVVRNCDVLHGSKHNLLIGSGRLIGGSVKFAEWSSSKTLGVFYLDEPNGATAYCEGTEFEWTTADLAALNNMSALLCHRGVSATTVYAPVIIKDAVARYCSNAWNIGGAESLLLDNCQSIDCRAFAPVNIDTEIWGGLCATPTLTVQCSAVSAQADGTTLTVGGGFTTRLYWTNTAAFVCLSANATIDFDDVVFDGSRKAVTSRAIGIGGAASNLALTVRNTDFTGMDVMYFGTLADTTLDSDFNTVPSGIDNTINGTTYTTFAAYQSATGQDANSTVV